MRCRVYERPDGTVRVVSPSPGLGAPGESEQAVLARVAAEAEQRDPSLAGLPFTDVDAATLPNTRARRHAWRVAGRAVVVDPRVPAPPDPQAAILAKVDAATTVTGLRDALRDVIRGRG